MSQYPPPGYQESKDYPAYPTDPNRQNVNADAPPPQPAYLPNTTAPYPSAQPSGYGLKPDYGQPDYGQPMHGYSNPEAYGSNPVPGASDEPMALAGSFSDKTIRRAFIRKVYLILFSQLLVTFGCICLFIYVKPIKDWVQSDGLWFYLLAYGLFIVLYIVLACCPKVRREYPWNFICLAVFTLSFSYLTATISSFHDTSIVMMAAGITALVCLAISIFAIQTKIDFTMCYGLLFVLFMVLFFFGWACLITFYTMGSNRILSCVYGALAALLFGLFLIYDTQQVIGGRKYELSPEEYIYGALQLYIDIVYIFIIILGFMGKN